MTTDNNPFNAQGVVDIGVEKLIHAASYMQRPPHWQSGDGSVDYFAATVGDQPDYQRLLHMPVGLVYRRFKHWGMLRLDREDNDKKLMYYSLPSGFLMRKTVLARSVGDPSLTDLDYCNEVIKRNEDLILSDLDDAEPIDYAHVFGAILDLEPVLKTEIQRVHESIRNQTPEERYLERMAKYEPMFAETEVDKSSGPRWWGLSIGSFSYAVFASSPEEACVMAEDELGTDTFFYVFANPFPEDRQESIGGKIGQDKKIGRLIPFFDIPWPDDFGNMTDEQKEAFEELRREHED